MENKNLKKFLIEFKLWITPIIFYVPAFYIWWINKGNPYDTTIFGYQYKLFPFIYILVISIPVLYMGRLGKELRIAITMSVTIFLVIMLFLCWSYQPGPCIKEAEQYYENTVKDNKDSVLKSTDYLLSLSLFFTTLYVPYFAGWVFIFKRYLEYILSHSLKDRKIRGAKTGGIPLFLLSISICCNLVSLGATNTILFAGFYHLSNGRYFDYECIKCFLINQFFYFVYAVFFLLTSSLLIFYYFMKGKQTT